MGSGPVDLRTSARDVLALGQKVSSVLRRHAEWLAEELKQGDLQQSPEVDAKKVEEHQAVDLQSKIQQNIQILQKALKETENVQDAEVPRTLREHVDTLQSHIRKALQTIKQKDKVADRSLTKGTPKGGRESNKTVSTPIATTSSATGFDPLSSFAAEYEAEAAKASPPPTVSKKAQKTPVLKHKTPPATKASPSASNTAPASSSSSSSFNRRVPRGLFSSSTCESMPPPSEPASSSLTAPQQPLTAPWVGSLAPSPHIPTTSTAVASHSLEPNIPSPKHDGPSVDDPMPRRSRLSRHLASTNSPTSPLFPPQPPSTSNSPPHSASPVSPSQSFTTAATSTTSQRPTPIQTKFPPPSSPLSSSANHSVQEERLSKLTEELERAMNPTLTETVPQHTFLQGSKLILLPNDDDDDLHGAGAIGSDEVGYIRIGGGSSSTLRRQRSIGRKGLRILSRSRSRSISRPGRSNSQSESSAAGGGASILTSASSRTGTYRRSKHHPPQPIAIGTVPMPVLADGVDGWMSSSPMNQAGVNPSSSSEGPSGATATASQVRRRGGGGERTAPYASEVTVSQPVRIGRGIGSFTMYTITLTLTYPASSSSAMSDNRLLSPTLRGDGPEQTLSVNGSASNASPSFIVRNNHNLRHREQRGEDTSESDNLSKSAHDIDTMSASTRGVGTANGGPLSPASTTHQDRDERHEPSIVSAPVSLSDRPMNKATAAMLLTRSLSFPELSLAAERLLQECKSYEQTEYVRRDDGRDNSISDAGTNGPLTAHWSPKASLENNSSLWPPAASSSTSAPTSHTRAATTTDVFVADEGGDRRGRRTREDERDAWHRVSHGSEMATTTATTIATTATNGTETSASAPVRVIQVRKRYSDFVVLRAKIVATFKEPKKAKRKKQTSNPATNNTARPSGAAAASASLSVGSRPPTQGGRRAMSQMSSFSYRPMDDSTDDEERSEEGNDDDDDDDYDDYSSDMSAAARPRMPATTWINLGGLPKLPPKKVVGKFKPEFIEKRRRDLEYFLQWVVAHPVLGQSSVVVQWFLES
ncbi:hypothetical protein BGW42_000931 [Actinomortierella wolfii]|nr:hypothetical protein BGW42_000931 [Actinomortierella wolfii]